MQTEKRDRQELRQESKVNRGLFFRLSPRPNPPICHWKLVVLFTIDVPIRFRQYGATIYVRRL